MCEKVIRTAKRATVIVTTNPLDHEGGVVNYYNLLLAHFESEVVSLEQMTFGSRTRDYYAPVRRAFLYPLYYTLDLTRLLLRLCTDRRVRIVQVNPSLLPIPLVRDGLIVLCARMLGRRVVVFYRGWRRPVAEWLRRIPGLRHVFRWIYRMADCSLVLASPFRAALLEMGWDPGEVRVTTTTYDVERIPPLRDRSEKPPRFLFLGRVSEAKGVSQLLVAAKALRDRGWDFELVIVGGGVRVRTLEEYGLVVKAYGLDRVCRLTGPKRGAQKFEAYAESDVFVLPSWSEGCPNSVVEALGCGLFVIATNVGALPELIDAGWNGALVKPGDTDGLVERMAWAAANVEDLRRRRVSICGHAAARFSVQCVCEQLVEVYHLVMRVGVSA